MKLWSVFKKCHKAGIRTGIELRNHAANKISEKDFWMTKNFASFYRHFPDPNYLESDLGEYMGGIFTFIFSKILEGHAFVYFGVGDEKISDI